MTDSSRISVVDNRALRIHTKTPHKIIESIEHSALLAEKKGSAEVLVKWGLPQCQKLVELGYDPPSPIRVEYPWAGKFTPYEHQYRTAEFLSLRNKAFCFNEQGTGKTASVVWACDYLMQKRQVRRVLIICPLSIMKSAWQQELFQLAMHRSCTVAHGTASQRRKLAAEGSDFVIVNFDGIAVIEEQIATGGFDLVVVDEANAYKNASTSRWKTLNRLMKGIPRLWMLTGTPAAQAPVDAFGLAKLVNPGGVPQYYGRFREQVMHKVSQYVWAPKAEARSIVHKALQPAIRFERAQCIDLPDLVESEREVPLTPQQQKYYEILRQHMIMEADGEEVSAQNAANQLTKLLQISGGAVYTDEREVIEFDVKTRLAAVKEVVDECLHKVLVFVPFTHTIELLHAYLAKSGITCEIIAGNVNLTKRSDRVKRFQEQADPKVLIIQPQAASHGLTLTAASSIVWYAPVTSVETYLQANARINRPGQKNEMSIVHLVGSPVERKLYNMLRGNVREHTKLIELYRAEISGK